MVEEHFAGLDFSAENFEIGVGQWETPVTLHLFLSVEFPYAGDVAGAFAQLQAASIDSVYLELQYRKQQQ
jgi:hypothetical protein